MIIEMKTRKKSTFLFLAGLLWLCGCGALSSSAVSDAEAEFHSGSEAETAPGAETGTEAGKDVETGAEPALVYESSMELQYAENFTVDHYEGGYTMLTTTMDGAQFLPVPEGMEAPSGLSEEIVVLQRPVKDIYLVASSAMDMFSGLDGLDAIAFSGQKEDGWYIESAREAMAKGDILYAGKYNKPDYELIVSKNCALAIENMMISHSPEVVENLEDFGIPVMIEYSSYESHPLGRVEWIRFYGALLGKEEEVEKLFAEQTAILESVSADERTDKTVAFFFVTSNGLMRAGLY